MASDTSGNSAINLWSGIYASYQEALDRSVREQSHPSGFNSSAYSSNRWLQNLENRLRLAKQGIPAKPSRLPEVVSELCPQTIIDLGGGNGWLLHLLPKWFTYSRCNYLVLEPINQIDQLQRIGGHPCLRWLPSDNPSEWRNLPEPKLLYSLSMLQYVEDFSLLESIVRFHRPSWIILEDVPCTNQSQFFTLQNFYEFRIPYRFISKTDLQTSLINLGYQLDESVSYEASIDPRVRLQIEGCDNTGHHFKGFMSFRFSLSET